MKKILYNMSWFNWLFPQIIYCSWTGLSIQFKCLLAVLLTFCLQSTISMETFLNLNKQYKLHLPPGNYFELPFLKRQKKNDLTFNRNPFLKKDSYNFQIFSDAFSPCVKVVIMVKDGWKWMKVDKMNVTRWKWMKVNENGWSE